MVCARIHSMPHRERHRQLPIEKPQLLEGPPKIFIQQAKQRLQTLPTSLTGILTTPTETWRAPKATETSTARKIPIAELALFPPNSPVLSAGYEFLSEFLADPPSPIARLSALLVADIVNQQTDPGIPLPKKFIFNTLRNQSDDDQAIGMRYLTAAIKAGVRSYPETAASREARSTFETNL